MTSAPRTLPHLASMLDGGLTSVGLKGSLVGISGQNRMNFSLIESGPSLVLLDALASKGVPVLAFNVSVLHALPGDRHCSTQPQPFKHYRFHAEGHVTFQEERGLSIQQQYGEWIVGIARIAGILVNTLRAFEAAHHIVPAERWRNRVSQLLRIPFARAA